MYLVLQPRGMHLRAHTRTRSLKDLYAFHDGEARGNAIVKGSSERFPVGLSEVVVAAERLLRRGDRGVDRNPVRAVL